MITATIHAGARSICTSEMSAAGDQQLVGERIDDLPERRDLLAPPRQVAVEPVGERGERRRSRRRRAPSARRGSAGPSNFVSSTTTSSGTRKMRATRQRVRQVHRLARFYHNRITSWIAMKAILLAGGKGTRLRPLTIHTPKPIVPIFDRPFLHYQLDLLSRCRRSTRSSSASTTSRGASRRSSATATSSASSIRYVVEPAPLGTGGADPLRRRLAAPNRSSSSTATC